MEKVDILSLDVKDLQDILKEHEINGFVYRHKLISHTLYSRM